MRSATFPPAHPAPVAIPDNWLRTARVPGRSEPAYARRSAVPSPGDWLLALYYTAALFGFGLVSFMPSMLGTQSRPISIGYHVLILVAGLTILLTRPTPFRARRSLGFAAFAVFWILYSARMINDLLIRDMVMARPKEMYWTMAFGVCVIPALTFFETLKPDEYATQLRVVWIFLILTCVAAIVVDLPHLTSRDGRLAGNDTFNPIDLGHIGVSLAVLGICALVRKKAPLLRNVIPSALAALLGLAVMLLAGSRSPLVALIVSLCVIVATHIKQRRIVLIVAIILVGIALLPYAVDNLTSAGGSLVGRVNYLQSRSNVQSDIRSTLWGYAWQHFLERPVFGTSIDLPEGGYPHNILLEAFLSTGAAGGGLVLFMMVHGLIRSYWLIRQDERRMWLALFYMQYLVLGLFSGALYDNWMFWCLYAAVISSTESLKRGRRGVRRR